MDQAFWQLLAAGDVHDLRTTDLLKAKELMSQELIPAINATVQHRMSDRLDELMKSILHSSNLNVVWEDISLVSKSSVVSVTGIRFYEEGDVIDVDGEEVEITADNNDSYAMRIKLGFTFQVFAMLLSPKVPVSHIIAAMGHESNPVIETDDDPNPPRRKLTVADEALITKYDQHKTKH